MTLETLKEGNRLAAQIEDAKNILDIIKTDDCELRSDTLDQGIYFTDGIVKDRLTEALENIIENLEDRFKSL